MFKSKSYMEDMTKTIGDNQGRIGFLESLNKQLEGTVQVKHQQTEEVRFFLSFSFSFSLSFFFFFSISQCASQGYIANFVKHVLLVTSRNTILIADG